MRRCRKVVLFGGCVVLTTNAVPRVAYVHIPKTGGSSLLAYFSDTRGPACNFETVGNFRRLCNCRDPRCRDKTAIAIMETTHVQMKNYLKGSKMLWVAVIRQPERWFYSAVAQWCGNGGRGTKGCQGDATLETLLEAHWFEPLTEPRSVKKYFWHANFQSRTLGDFFEEESWLVCALETGLDVALTAISLALGLEPIHLKHANQNHWPKLPAFRLAVPWPIVASYYQVDMALWHRITDAGGSIAASRDPQLRTDVLRPALRSHLLLANSSSLNFTLLDLESLDLDRRRRRRHLR